MTANVNCDPYFFPPSYIQVKTINANLFLDRNGFDACFSDLEISHEIIYQFEKVSDLIERLNKSIWKCVYIDESVDKHA